MIGNLSNAEDYIRKLNLSINQFIKLENFSYALNLLSFAWEKGNGVYICGNGGSAAMAQHFATDWSKGLFQLHGIALKAICLNTNSSLISAISNDISYSHSFSTQIQMFAETNDVLILISSSGESENIIEAAIAARNKNMKVLTLTGNNPHPDLVKNSNSILKVQSDDIQIIEDTHNTFGHIFLKFMSN
jgi:phosphoheptose isomerase